MLQFSLLFFGKVKGKGRKGNFVELLKSLIGKNKKVKGHWLKFCFYQKLSQVGVLGGEINMTGLF